MNRYHLAALLAGALPLLSGCSSSQVAASGALETGRPPASPVATDTGRDLNLAVQAVTIPTSGKTWSHGAAWDEYTVHLTNHSDTSLVIERALLVDVRDAEIAPGDQPGDLEKLSKARWTRYIREGVPVEPRAVDPMAARREAANKNVPAQVLGWTLLCAAPPVYLGATSVALLAYASERAGTKQEFQRRRFKLPLSLASGQEVDGSFFFPVTPGPRRLVLAYRREGELRRAEIDLHALANLHLPTANIVAQTP